MILNVVSYPRSGNSFFTTQLLQFGTAWRRNGKPVTFKPVGRMFQGNESAKFYGVTTVPYNNDEFDSQPNDYIIDESSVYGYKRHDYPSGFAGPRVYLIRDGRDVLCSYAYHNAVNEAIMADPANQEIISLQGVPMRLVEAEAWKIVTDPNAQWGELVEAGIDHPNTVAVVRYLEMKQNSTRTVKTALASAGFEVEKVAEPLSFEKLHAFCPHFYRRGRPGGFTEMNPDIIAEFTRRNISTLRRLNYV